MNAEIERIKKYVRAANYLSAGQIYLEGNFLLKEKLTFDHIKTRLLGHWGTCPGINFTYACLNNLIVKTGANMLFVLGPGHGFPAVQANVFLEGTLAKYYPEAKKDEKGIGYIMHNFSWPYQFPSHVSPATPGAILEGGELGYSLATSYGAILDNPDLIVTCLVGDGEAETATAATAWHLSKFIDPATNGAVLPILHLNGYKISGPTVFGRMKNEDLLSLFRGYGYEPMIVEGYDDKVYADMVKALDRAYASIRKIQKEARANPNRKLEDYFRFPMIILKTPKGWTGIKHLYSWDIEGRGKKFDAKVEGNCFAHQVVGREMKTDPAELAALDAWMRSYKFEELFNAKTGFIKDIEANVPREGLRMGENKTAFGIPKGDRSRDLLLPDISAFDAKISAAGASTASSMIQMGQYFRAVVDANHDRRNFRLFSPDETYSNRLQYIFAATPRAFAGKIQDWDIDLARDGRVIEMLSENALHGLAQGYALTGRFAVFPSYESFLMVAASMAEQYSKFLKIARKTDWRGDVPGLTYIITSSGWRQEHNGFSHQNPGFIADILLKKHDFINVYFPADMHEAVLVAEKCLSAKNEMNVIVAEKTVEPIWRTFGEAKEEIAKGLSIWDFASDENPDIVIAGCGQYLVKEALAAVEILKEEAPEAKVRFVNILELSPNSANGHNKITEAEFEHYFTKDKPAIFNFHGYPETMEQVLFYYVNSLDRFSVHGYLESGSTTTSLDLHIRNKTDRWNLAAEAVRMLADRGVIERGKADAIVKKYEQKIRDHKDYIMQYGEDPEEILKWQWKGKK
ncbi:MAG: phosphoketolase family protein [Patescibacteria group bacterium]|nr:phosphoketolase family protein [Patescibacteria group bacterium]MDE1945996.1 phosphoketolase family protein [Patescibacteria group bacterium]